jgi:hypothetical protein
MYLFLIPTWAVTNNQNIQIVKTPAGETSVIITLPAFQVMKADTPPNSLNQSELQKDLFGPGGQHIVDLAELARLNAIEAALAEVCDNQESVIYNLLKEEGGIKHKLAVYFSNLLPGSEPGSFVIQFSTDDRDFIPAGVGGPKNPACPYKEGGL